MFANLSAAQLGRPVYVHGAGSEFCTGRALRVDESRRCAVYTRGERSGCISASIRTPTSRSFRVDTDGRIRVLFPRDPWEDNFARGGETSKSMGMSSPASLHHDDYLALATSSRWPPLIRSSTIKSKADSTGTIASSPMVAYAVIRMWL